MFNRNGFFPRPVNIVNSVINFGIAALLIADLSQNNDPMFYLEKEVSLANHLLIGMLMLTPPSLLRDSLATLSNAGRVVQIYYGLLTDTPVPHLLHCIGDALDAASCGINAAIINYEAREPAPVARSTQKKM
jgi:hypothetical protein